MKNFLYNISYKKNYILLKKSRPAHARFNKAYSAIQINRISICKFPNLFARRKSPKTTTTAQLLSKRPMHKRRVFRLLAVIAFTTFLLFYDRPIHVKIIIAKRNNMKLRYIVDLVTR